MKEKGRQKTLTEFFTPPTTANQGANRPRLHQSRNPDQYIFGAVKNRVFTAPETDKVNLYLQK